MGDRVKRSWFISALAALPFVGRFTPKAVEITEIWTKVPAVNQSGLIYEVWQWTKYADGIAVDGQILFSGEAKTAPAIYVSTPSGISVYP